MPSTKEEKEVAEEFKGNTEEEVISKIQTGQVSSKTKKFLSKMVRNPVFKGVTLVIVISAIGAYIYYGQLKPYYKNKELQEYNEKVKEKAAADSLVREEAIKKAEIERILLEKQKEEERKRAEELIKKKKTEELNKKTLTLQEAQDSIPKSTLK